MMKIAILRLIISWSRRSRRSTVRRRGTTGGPTARAAMSRSSRARRIVKRRFTRISGDRSASGVTFPEPGYRGGSMAIEAFNNNGVLIQWRLACRHLIDGRRVDELSRDFYAFFWHDRELGKLVHGDSRPSTRCWHRAWIDRGHQGETVHRSMDLTRRAAPSTSSRARARSKQRTATSPRAHGTNGSSSRVFAGRCDVPLFRHGDGR